MRLYPININPYINLLRCSNLDDRLEYAFKFIDEVIDLFSRYGQKEFEDIILKNGERILWLSLDGNEWR